MTQATVGEVSAEHAKELGLRYVSDTDRGWTRRRQGEGFVYVDADGETIKDAAAIERITKLVIPPAWEKVWICPSARGHIQATGRDAKGRKVYRYHDKFRAYRDETKFGKLAEFARCLPSIRERIDQDMKAPCMTRERVLGTVLHLLDVTHMRVGNDVYAKENNHFGLTTLRRSHVEVNGSQVVFEFVGKSGQEQHVEVNNPRVAKAIKHCTDLPGYELFKYVDEDKTKRRVDSEDVNEYIREISGQDFTAKHFRTWGGTVIATVVLCALDPFTDEKELKDNLVTAAKTTAAQLGNRPATCRKYYIHPLIFEAYQDGSLGPAFEEAVRLVGPDAERNWMSPEEGAVLTLLEGEPVKKAA